MITKRNNEVTFSAGKWRQLHMQPLKMSYLQYSYQLWLNSFIANDRIVINYRLALNWPAVQWVIVEASFSFMLMTVVLPSHVPYCYFNQYNERNGSVFYICLIFLTLFVVVKPISSFPEIRGGISKCFFIFTGLIYIHMTRCLIINTIHNRVEFVRIKIIWQSPKWFINPLFRGIYLDELKLIYIFRICF